MQRITSPKSTPNKPLWFFDEFFKVDSIKTAKERFYPNPQNETDQWNSFPVHIDLSKESFSVEYEFETAWDPEKGPTTEWRTKTYVFREILAQEFQMEYWQSKYFLDANMDAKHNKYRAKYFLLRIVSAQERNLDILKREACFKPYENECKNVLHSIIQHIFTDHREFAPKITENIKAILEFDNKSDWYHRPKILLESVVDDIVKLRDDKKASLFHLDLDPNAKARLRSFISGSFPDIKKPIAITCNIEAGHYLISRINQIKGFKAATIEKAKIFQMGAFDFKASNHYKAFCKFSKKLVNPTRDRIDEVISAHLK